MYIYVYIYIPANPAPSAAISNDTLAVGVIGMLARRVAMRCSSSFAKCQKETFVEPKETYCLGKRVLLCSQKKPARRHAL